MPMAMACPRAVLLGTRIAIRCLHRPCLPLPVKRASHDDNKKNLQKIKGHCCTLLNPSNHTVDSSIAMEKKEAGEMSIRIAAEAERLRQKSGRAGNDEEFDDDEGDEGAGYNKKYAPKVSFRNPEAKFVLTRPLEPRHLEYAERHVGEVLSFTAEIENKLEMLGMFQPNYGFQFMRKPVSLIRPNSGLIARRLLSSAVEDRGTEHRRVIVAGKGGTGKSFILMQIAAVALMKKYVVVAVPRGSSSNSNGLGAESL